MKKSIAEVNAEITKAIRKYDPKKATKLFQELMNLGAGRNFRNVMRRTHTIAKKLWPD